MKWLGIINNKGGSMRKLSKWLVGMVLVSMLAVVGCSITPEQGKVIAQNAGLYSAVIWIAVDNPTAEQKASVSSILGILRDNADKLKDGQTYMEVVYPLVAKVIDTKVKPQDRPLCKAAAMTLLNGLDTLFAMHPEWKKDQTLVVQIVDAYVNGAQAGLVMSEKDPIIVQAKSTASARAKLFVQ